MPGPGLLAIVATPIGNLEDITLRALRILKGVDLIAAEDTRHSRKLLTHFGISRPLTSYFDHNKAVKGTLILEKLQLGLSVALITDAGTPCISDPGYQLVRDAVAAGITVVPLPGACAAVVALSASGLATDQFTFAGFLPNKQGKRRERLQSLAAEKGVLIFYESPKRAAASLKDMLEVFGDREIVLCRELTKIFEEFVRGTVSSVMAQLEGREIRGEVAILVSAPDAPAEDGLPSMEELLSRYLLEEGCSVKDAVKRVVAETGLSKSVVYAEALRLKG